MSRKKEDPSEEMRARDLVRSGEIGETAFRSERFGQGVVDRFLRRPVGNSERLWRRIDGSDPWDNAPPPPVEKPRGVYAAGRLVRNEKPAATQTGDGVPDWARKAQADRDAARSNPVAPPTTSDQKPAAKVDPMEKLKQAIAQRQAEEEARAAKRDAEARAAAALAPPPPEPEAAQPLALPKRQPTLTKAGRIRTGDGGAIGPPPVSEKTPPPQPTQRAYAAGRAPPPPKAAPKDLPIEKRMPPRIDPQGAGKAKAQAPVQHAYAAGRAPPPPKAPAKDLPLEMRRPPKPAGATSEPKDEAPHPPSRPESTSPSLPAPVQPPAARAPAAPQAPVAGGLPGQPPPPPKSPSNKASMDDIFGMAAQEGRVRVGRRAKPTAAAEPSATEATGAPETAATRSENKE